jgi:hypothetical protein
MNIFRCICALAFAVATDGVHAGDDSGATLLEANFNDKPLDQQIGTGGPEFGEPISIAGGLSTIVRAAPLVSPSLEFSESTSGTTRQARFEFLDGEEVAHGDVNIHMRIQAAQFDTFDIAVRESTTAAQAFTGVVFTNFGSLSASDAGGSLGTIGSYSVNTVYELGLLFHMDKGTYDIKLNGATLVSGRAHGITGRGIGAVLVGPGSLATPGALFYVDRLRVTRGDGIFRNDFE